jgi:two-component system chemotaxis response regulator CheB
MAKILVADDSALVRKVLYDIINADSDLQVTDSCMDGLSAYERVVAGGFDCLVMEMYLPKMNGMDVVRKLQENRVKIPIIIVTSSLKEDSDLKTAANQYGAVEFVVRPFRLFSEDRVTFETKLIGGIRGLLKLGKSVVPSASKIPYDGMARKEDPVRSSIGSTNTVRSSTTPMARQNPVSPVNSSGNTKSTEVFRGSRRLVAIASSTGGPQALHTLIPMLPKLNVPVVIVQHMPKGFTQSLAERIDQKSLMRIKEAEDGEFLQPNVVYLAPGGRHLEIRENANRQCYCRVFDDPPVNNLRPCADVMYRSLETCSFDEIVCVVLTGMGQDGSDGIESLGQKKKIYTITQSEETCVVYGMPKAADMRGLSNESAGITKIASVIARKLGV